MPPMGLALKQRIGGGGSPEDAQYVFCGEGGLLGSWSALAVNYATPTTGFGWQSSCSATTFVTGPGYGAAIGSAVIAGLNCPGHVGSDERVNDVPEASVGLTGSAVTIYMVMMFTRMDNPSEPISGGILQYGISSPVRSYQLRLTAGRPPRRLFLDELDAAGSENYSSYDMPGDMAAGAAGVLTLQSARSGGHLVRWRGVEISPAGGSSSGTLAPFVSDGLFLFASVEDRVYVDGIVGFVASVGNVVAAQIVAYAALHDGGTMAGHELTLATAWGL